ncbi:predicted protein [Postia placenta Mad-698-R]|uniref:Uncharacterized protein n=1 Tax=Postia placenta MAD-698-R-SB12 TaxID=670580 RepID=A0A1X6MQU4_9APHY|nr:hypothetical protein POSPLADRAFT_1151919 [Postia placenta MAD-698-R-SB12]EED79832.1 predicted protein [Postia placenta Mad-698-R]OSX58771.1 hypothetical protein POSPLADRAFT_1151919 [Postia placenta MAD-698-R-SB12]
MCRIEERREMQDGAAAPEAKFAQSVRPGQCTTCSIGGSGKGDITRAAQGVPSSLHYIPKAGVGGSKKARGKNVVYLPQYASGPKLTHPSNSTQSSPRPNIITIHKSNPRQAGIEELEGVISVSDHACEEDVKAAGIRSTSMFVHGRSDARKGQSREARTTQTIEDVPRHLQL